MSTSFRTSHPQDLTPSAHVELAGDEPLERAAWKAVQQTLEARLAGHTFRTYISSARILESSEGRLKLGYASLFLRDMVRDHYRKQFELELLSVANRQISVELDVYADETLKPVPEPALLATTPAMIVAEPSAPATRPRISVERRGRGEPAVSRRSVNGIDSRYTFDSFVVGASNQFAYAACQAVADAPGCTYNPLFLYGGVGLGKTHLMQAVGNAAASRGNGDARVLYRTSEQFTNDLIGAIQDKRMHEFRKRYRECDVLLIDDVQFIARKPATEEEFFHTFNALHSQGKQIIVSSDTVPHEIDRLEERLRSRFQWGLIADIQPPELETRVAILKSKAATMQLPLDDEIAQFLAVHIRQNVRELEGSLIRIAAFSHLMQGPLTVEVCKDVLRSVLVNKSEVADSDQIIKACSDYFHVSIADIKGPVRKKQIARARQAAMYLCRNLTKSSYPELGEKFKKDHSTVINAVQRVPTLMAADPVFRKSVETLERDLSA